MNKNIRIIGITGKARAGKNTVSEYLGKNHGYVDLQLASRLKEACMILDPIVNIERLGIVRFSEAVKTEGWDEAKKMPEVRRVLQVMGTDVLRNLFGQDVHVNFLIKDIQKLAKEGQSLFTVSDVRFDNEAYGLQEIGAEIWSVESDRKNDLNGQASSHASEKGIDPMYVTKRLRNLGTIEDLHEAIRNAIK